MKPINISEYETLAKTCMDSAVWDYIQGGSDDEVTLRVNCTAFERLQLREDTSANIAASDLRTNVLGTPVSMPILVAPISFHCLVHSEGECATAHAAGRGGTLMVAATFATHSLEEITSAGSGPFWFQLYLYHSLQVSKQLVQRAESLGYRAIVLTVDVPRLGKRERDIRNNFGLPPSLHLANFADDGSTKTRLPLPLPVTWETLDWLKSVTSLPVLVKGIVTAEDAKLAVAHGVAGIIVSNHGGRQLDGTVASIEAIPEIVEAVEGHCEVYLDGGIRRGTDVLKSLALGARAILVGRPILWGLAVDGAEGVYHVLELLRIELERAMILAGCHTVESIDRSLVRMM